MAIRATTINGTTHLLDTEPEMGLPNNICVLNIHSSPTAKMWLA